MLKKNFLEVGKIVSTHGLKGEVKIDPWCNNSHFLCGFKELYFDEYGHQKIKVLYARAHKNIVLIKFPGIDSIEQAEKLRGKVLFNNRKEVKLPEGEYFIEEILGVNVFNADTNFCYGKITDVLKTGANDVYQITNERKKNYLVPAIKDVICKVDIENNLMLIRPLEGLFDD